MATTGELTRAEVYEISDNLRAAAKRSFVAEARSRAEPGGHWVYFVIGCDLERRYAVKIGQTGAKDPRERVRDGSTFSPGLEFVDAIRSSYTDRQVRSMAEELGWFPISGSALVMAGGEWVRPADEPRLLFDFRPLVRELICALRASMKGTR